MKKGVATSTIVALLLAIIVLAIMAYLIYRAVTKSPLGCQECAARFTAWCSKCYILHPPGISWDNPNVRDDDLKECMPRCSITSGPDPERCNGAEDSCRTYGVPL